MNAWRTRTVSDLIGYTGMRLQPDLSHDSEALEALWQQALDEWGAGRTEVSSTDGRLLVDLRFVDGRWVVLAFGRGAGFGGQGLLQLVEAPAGLGAAEVWRRVQVARDERGWLSAARLGEEVEPLRVTSAAAGRVVRLLLGGATVVTVPEPDAAEAIAVALEMLPEHLARGVVWSTGHLPHQELRTTLVTGEPSAELRASAVREWKRVETALARQREPHLDLSKVEAWLVRSGSRGEHPASTYASAPDFASLADDLARNRPRSESERLAEHGLRPYDVSATWHAGTLALLDTLAPSTLVDLVAHTPALGLRLLEQAEGTAATVAFETLVEQSRRAAGDPFGLAGGQPPVAAARLFAELGADRVATLADVVGAARLSDEQLRRLSGWFDLCGIARADLPELFPFDVHDAVRLLEDRDLEAFVALVDRCGATAEDVLSSMLFALGRLRPDDVVRMVDACYEAELLRLRDLRTVVANCSTPGFVTEAAAAIAAADRDVQLMVLDVIDNRPSAAPSATEVLTLTLTPAPHPRELGRVEATSPGPHTGAGPPHPVTGGPAAHGVAARDVAAGIAGRQWHPLTTILGCIGVLVAVAILAVNLRGVRDDPRVHVPAGPATSSTPSGSATVEPDRYTLLDTGTPTTVVVLDPDAATFAPPTVAVAVGDLLSVIAPIRADGRRSALPPLQVDGTIRTLPDGLLVRFDKPGSYRISDPETSAVLVVGVQRAGA